MFWRSGCVAHFFCWAPPPPPTLLNLEGQIHIMIEFGNSGSCGLGINILPVVVENKVFGILEDVPFRFCSPVAGDLHKRPFGM